MKTHHRLLAVAAALALAACATPPAAIQQANQTVKLTEGLRAELLRYQRNMELVAQRRDATQTRDNEAIAFVNRELAVLDGHRSAAGGDERSVMAMEERLRRAVETRRAALAAEDKARADAAAAIAQRSKAASSAPEKLVAVQKAMAELGTELSVEERLKIVTSFAADVKARLDANAKAADDAADKAAPVPTPAASAASAP